MTIELSGDYWNNRYIEQQTGWDVGEVSTPLKNYIDQLEHKNLRVMIPGCGNAYEAAYLLQQGFTNVTCIDISPVLCAELESRLGDKGLKVICADFFTHQGQYDLILEQTFFCALNPAIRMVYATHMNELLASGGKLAGVLFNCDFEKDGPPFGGSASEYQTYFEPYFTFKHFTPCYNSITKRAGNELFVVLQKNSKF
ncbi:MAG: methyltransferase domain-containing protein [Bacteroidia bacterium]|nr:methyltransferase domain-containing protein [Bacteroidia bacterium]